VYYNRIFTVREEKIKKKVKKKDKWGSIRYTNKQTIYIAPKSKIKSRGKRDSMGVCTQGQMGSRDPLVKWIKNLKEKTCKRALC